MIKKMWVKFNGMDVECLCDEHHKKCKKEECKPYVVKFVEITKEEEEKQVFMELDRTAKKFQREISNTLRKMQKVKL